MAIEILLRLQELRAALGPGVEAFFVTLTNFATSTLSVFIALIVFWCIDKATGREMFGIFTFSSLSNQLIKNTVCEYRPWVQDTRIHVSEGAKPGATGYSFPSGHTVAAVSLFGYLGWKKRANKVLMWLCYIFVLLVAFSRNFLGCHYVHDVLAAFAETVLVIWASRYVSKWMEKNEDKDIWVVAGVIVITALACIYWVYKPYPTDYVEIDLVEMQVDCFQIAGLVVGFVIGWILERRYIKFTTEGLAAKVRVIRGIVGTAVVVITNRLSKFATQAVDPRAAKFIQRFCLVMVVFIVAPLIFKWIEGLMAKSKANNK